MKNQKNKCLPEIGSVVTYVGTSRRLARGGYNVRVVAETSKNRMVVEAVGRGGQPVRFSVKNENRAPLQPTLF